MKKIKALVIGIVIAITISCMHYQKKQKRALPPVQHKTMSGTIHDLPNDINLMPGILVLLLLNISN